MKLIWLIRLLRTKIDKRAVRLKNNQYEFIYIFIYNNYINHINIYFYLDLRILLHFMH